MATATTFSCNLVQRYQIARMGSSEVASAQGRRESRSPRAAAKGMHTNPKAQVWRPGTSRPAASPVTPPAQSHTPATAHCPANSWVSPAKQGPRQSRGEPCRVEVELLAEGRWGWPPATSRSARRRASGPSVEAPGRRSPQRHRRLGDADREGLAAFERNALSHGRQ